MMFSAMFCNMTGSVIRIMLGGDLRAETLGPVAGVMSGGLLGLCDPALGWTVRVVSGRRCCWVTVPVVWWEALSDVVDPLGECVADPTGAVR